MKKTVEDLLALWNARQAAHQAELERIEAERQEEAKRNRMFVYAAKHAASTGRFKRTKRNAHGVLRKHQARR